MFKKGHIVLEHTRTLISKKRRKQIPPMLGKKHSLKTIQKMSKTAKSQHRNMSKIIKLSVKARKGKPAWNKGISAWWVKGKNHPCWKGGISKINKRMHIPEWKEIRKEVYARDNWTCQICKKHCHNDIQCHHIVPYRITQDNSESNLITLCVSCHGKEEHKYYKSLKGQLELNF